MICIWQDKAYDFSMTVFELPDLSQFVEYPE